MDPHPDEPVREGEDFSRADWSGRDLTGGHFVRCRFVDADLSEVTTAGVVFEECDLSGAKLNASVHRATAFLRCRFRRTTLFAAELHGCKLTGSEFVQATLRPLEVTDGDWSYVRLRGAELARLDLTGLRLAESDLTDADLQGTVLRDADLSYADLRGARLSGADLRGACLDGVALTAVDWRGARIDLALAAQLATALGAQVG